MASDGPLRVLHVNLSARGLGRYGLVFAEALHRHPEVQAVSAINRGLLESDTFASLARTIDARTLDCDGMPAKATSLRALLRLARSVRPHVVHDTSGTSVALGAIAWTMLSRRVPVVVTVHDPTPHSGMGTSPKARLARWLLRTVPQHVLVHGAACRDDLIAQGLAPSRVSETRHGHLGLFDAGRFGGLAREPRTVLFFGELRPNKGFRLLLPLARRVHARFPDARFVVAGSPRSSRELERSGWPAELRALLEQMKQLDYFEVHDRFIPDEEVERFFRRAGITIMPYLDATQSGVAMIAMPLGSVVLCSDAGDLPGTVEQGNTGFVARADIDALATRLEKMLEDPQRLEEVRERARRRALVEYDWDRIVAGTVERYREVVGRRE